MKFHLKDLKLTAGDSLIRIMILLFFYFFINNLSKGQEGYKITIRISGINDSVCYLAHYFGDKTYLSDTAFAGKKNTFEFEGDTALPGGVYIVAGEGNNKYFELIIDKEQFFSVIAEATDIPGSIQFKGSAENELFYNYINYSASKRNEISLIMGRLNKMPKESDSAEILKSKIGELNREIDSYTSGLINDNPDGFVSVLLKATKEPEAKSTPLLENGRPDSVFVYYYYKQHYWDNFAPADARLLRTPLYHKKLEKYFTEVIYQHPDTAISEVDNFIQKTRPNKETFKYVVWYLTYKFETSKIMGFDEIFVHMIDRYYTTGEAYWSDSTVNKTLKKRADALRTILIGNKAPDLILIDTGFSFVSLHHVEAPYLVLLFYESDCGHCKKEIDELKTWYNSNNLGLEIFAACTDTSIVKWKKFIYEKKMSWINVNATRSITRDYHDLYDISVTPSLFLLDEDKKIIAKRLKTEQLISFLENYHKNLMKNTNESVKSF
jgi:peroxiredoxin